MIKVLFLLCWLRTIVFYVLWVIWTLLWCSFAIFAVYFVPEHARHGFVIKTFCVVTLFLSRVVCGITWKVEGKENIPEQPCVVASNHQSPWETFLVQMLFTPQSTVIKKELLFIPFFGWAFKKVNPIAIDRKDGRSALQQVVEKGKERLQNGHWVAIFPEGTRYHWPEVGRFTRGTASLAVYAGVPILPMAHNAGRYWPAHKWLKTPGEITVRIGPAVESKGKEIPELTDEVREWVVSNSPH
ncbi:lysophospholipid acyltransferase family protein [Parendozoicomonas sp. Alg238-R29]|uniref:lysophospholipid acyltransferase family protein n=1 Tax=Parendozoicomonas sp. Alg238-R29 TaxID=2993446 RepID=UPI00248F1A25|nr:lysophospholipid acyltransferase family protein [Parendozoicomonas sp. Alg238-R29]